MTGHTQSHHAKDSGNSYRAFPPKYLFDINCSKGTGTVMQRASGIIREHFTRETAQAILICASIAGARGFETRRPRRKGPFVVQETSAVIL